jgi:hypothetical protein
MIAQVFTLSGAPAGQTPTPGAAAQAAMKETREADGCEGLYLFSPREGGDGLAIVLWRDDAALAAMRKREEEHLDEIRAEAPDLPPVPPPNLYDVTTA